MKLFKLTMYGVKGAILLNLLFDVSFVTVVPGTTRPIEIFGILYLSVPGHNTHSSAPNLIPPNAFKTFDSTSQVYTM